MMSLATAVDDMHIELKGCDGRAERPVVATGLIRLAAAETLYVCIRFPNDEVQVSAPARAVVSGSTTALLADDDIDAAPVRLVHYAREALDADGAGVNMPTRNTGMDGGLHRWLLQPLVGRGHSNGRLHHRHRDRRQRSRPDRRSDDRSEDNRHRQQGTPRRDR